MLGRRDSAVWRTAVALVVVLTCSAELLSAQSPPRLAASAVAQMQVLKSIKMARTAQTGKIDSRLYLGLLHQRNDARLAPLTDFRFMKPEADGRVPVDIVVASTGGVKAVVNRLVALGGVVKDMSYTYRRVSARMRLEDLEVLAAMPEVRKIRQAIPAVTHAINVSEGDLTHGAQQARGFYGVTGTGVKVCVLSDGVDSLASLQASGDLPAVDVLPGQAGSGDEGSAMLEIIHDLAPGATLGFATASTSEASFAQNILDLAADGCNIIVDDIIYLDESPFQDGPVAQSVNTVTASGVLYFSSAGNEGNTDDLTSGTWEGDFLSSGAADPAPLAGANLHDFGDGGNSLLIEAGFFNPALMIWAEHYDLATGSASTDFDVYDMDGGLTTIFDASTDVQDGAGGDDFPVELIGGGVLAGERLLVDLFAAGSTSSLPMFNLIVFRGEVDDALATSGATRGHSAAAESYSTAATPAAASFDGFTPDGPYPGLFTAANESESFTSDGPRRIILSPAGAEITPGNRTSTGGVVRQKPEITAADGVSTAAPGFNPFYGTSAAAPHAAALAALCKSAFRVTPAQLRTALIGSAIDIEAPGVDKDTGAGIVMAQQLLQLCGLDGPPGTLLDDGTPVPSQASGDGDVFIENNETWNLIIPLTNVGSVNATAVNAVLTSSTPGIAIVSGNAVYPNLVPGASGNNTTPYSFFVGTAVPCGSQIDFTLTVTYTGGPGLQTFNFSFGTGSPGTPVCDAPPPSPGPDVTGAMTVNVAPDGTATYTVTLTNNGGTTQPDDPDSDEFVDVLPPGVTLESATASSGTIVANLDTNTVSWNGSIPPAAPASVTPVSATAPPPVLVVLSIRLRPIPRPPDCIGSNHGAIAAGEIVSNQGSISFDADANGTNETNRVTDDPSTPTLGDPTTFTVAAACLSCTKTDGVAIATPGGSTTYTITASNAGPTAANPASLTDTFPVACTSVSYTSVAAGGATGNTAVGAGNINDLALNLPAGSSVTYSATCTISPAATGFLVNTATVASSTPDFDPADNSATDTDTIVLSALLDDGTPVPTQAVGDGDAFIEPNETWNLTIPLTNVGGGAATAINATLTTSTVGVTIVNSNSAYPDLAPTASGNNATPYSFFVGAAASCGLPIDFTLTVTYTGGPSPQVFTFSIGTGSPGTPVTFSYTGPPIPIPDSPGPAVSATLPVAAVSGNIVDVDFSIDGTVCTAADGATTVGLDHTFVADLQLTLISPFLTPVVVINFTDGGGNNFCQTQLDDESAGPSIQSVASANAPFTGSFTPNSPLSAFDGENPNGNWLFQAQDFVGGDVGNIRAWSVIITPAVCDAPAPQPANVTGTKTASGTFVPGGAITYTVVLTNSGAGPQNDNPGNEFTDILPASLTLVSASATSGTATPPPPGPPNTVTWNGSIAASGSVTITINATINPGTGGQTISNQGTISYDSDGNGTNDATRTTDDPGTQTPGDPTSVTVTGVTIVEIPTLSEGGLALLFLALVGAALLLLRCRQSA